MDVVKEIELLKYQNIFDILGNNISTNLTFDQIKELQQSYRESLSNIKQIHFEKGKGKTIHGVWYYMMDSNELTEVSNTLKKHLQIDSKS